MRQQVEEAFLGGRAPVEVAANGCQTVTINVKFEVHYREQDTLRRAYDRLMKNEGKFAPAR